MSHLTEDTRCPPPSYSDIVGPPCSRTYRRTEEDTPTEADPMLPTSRDEVRITENRLDDHGTSRVNDNTMPSFNTRNTDGDPLCGPVPYLYCHTCGSKQQIQLQAGTGNTFGQGPPISIAFPTNEQSRFSIQSDNYSHGGGYHGLQPGYPPTSIAPPQQQCNVAIQYNPNQPHPSGVQTVVNAGNQDVNNDQTKKGSVGCCIIFVVFIIVAILIAFILFTT